MYSSFDLIPVPAKLFWLPILFILLFWYGFSPGMELDSAQTDSAGALVRKHSAFPGSGMAISREAIIKANLENGARVLDQLPPFHYHDLGTPGTFSAVSSSGGNPEESRLFIDGIPIHSPYLGISDLNLIPISFAGAIRSGWNTEDSMQISRNSGDIRVDLPYLPASLPETDILYRIGDYERSMVNVGFRRKIAARSGIGIFADFQSFPGEYGERLYDGKNIGGAVHSGIRDTWDISGWFLNWNQDMNAPQGQGLGNQGPLIWQDRLIDERMLYAFRLRRTTRDNRIALSVYGSRFRREYRDSGDESTDLTRDNYDGIGLAWNRRLGIASVTAGGDFYSYRIHRGDGNPFNGNQASTSLSFSFEPGEKHTITAGAGFVYDKARDGLTTGDLRYQFRIAEFFGLWAGAARTGRLPSINETETFGGESFSGNEYSIGLAFDDNRIYRGGLLLIRRENIRDDVKYFLMAGNASRYYAGENRYYGATFHSQLNAGAHLRFMGSISGFQKPDGLRLLPVPDHYGAGGIEFIDLNRLILPLKISTRLMLRVRIFGGRSQLLFEPRTSRFRIIMGRGIAANRIFDIKGIMTVKSLSAFYEVDNILGTGYEPVLAYPFPKRTIRIGIRWIFRN